MAKRDRLSTLQRLAAHHEAEQARRLSERVQSLDSEERRLQQIRGYLAEYAANPGGRDAPLTVSRLRSNRGFIDRLRDAVDGQRGMVEIQRQQVDQQAAQWRSARSRSLSLERLGERLDRQEREHRERRTQAGLDEIASRRHGSGKA
ncbi:MAG: flagellar export protein FliJ [Gammaproteobacteria bacterium]|nr:flagellar export protein FliJ [Gammaproteobacteria bacterium]